MSKNTNISELINYLSYDGSGNIVFTTVSAAATNTDKFLVSDAGTLKFRTAAQLLSDIGAQASGSYQAALSGTGFVKISGSTISYDNSTYATETYVGTAISNLVASSPATLDTLNELALALGSDPNFATTVATSIGTKQAQLNGTGFVKVTGTTVSYDNSTYALDSAVVKLAGSQTITGVKTFTGAGNTFTQNTNFLDRIYLRSASTTDYTNLSGHTNQLLVGVIGATHILSFPENTNYTYTFPAASGTIAFTSNLSSYLPLAGGTLSGRLNGIVGGTAYNTAGLWLQGSSSTDGIAIGGTGGGDKTIDTYGGTLRLNGTANNGLYVGGAATFSSSIRAATLNLNTSPLSDRLLYISALLPTTGTSQFQAVLNGTFVNTATTLYGVYIGNNSNVNVTNSYALFLESTGGTGTITNKYGVYQSGGSDKNYFAGSVGVGINNPGSVFHVLVPETASNLSGVRIQGDTNSKLLVLGANATYAWIQSHGSVPLRLNELGNELIMGLGANVAIGISSSIGPKLDVRSTASYSSAMTQPAFFGSNDASGPLGMVIQTISGSGNAIRTEITSTRYGVSGNDLTLNRDSGAGSGGLTVKYQGNVGVNDANPAHNLDVNGNTRTQGTAMIGSGVGLLQFAMDGTRFHHYGYSHVHIKTSILKGSDTMINYNLRGYFYSPNNIDTDVAFYCYNGTNTPYGVTVNHKCWGGFTVSMYYSSDNYICICVDGLSTYGGFSLNWINSSLIQWGGRVFTLAWSRVNTASAQY